MADYGLKVSQDGSNVLTAADEALFFSTKFHSMKIYKTGEISLYTDGSGNGTASVAHDLDFAPAFRVFVEDGSTYYPDPTHPSGLFTELSHLHAYTDDSYIYVQATGALSSTTYYIKYFLFADLAQGYPGSSAAGAEDYGLKISKPGVDVTTAEIYNLSFNSRLKTMKFDPTKIGSFTMHLDESGCIDHDTQTTSTNVAHGLGYAPYLHAKNYFLLSLSLLASIIGMLASVGT